MKTSHKNWAVLLLALTAVLPALPVAATLKVGDPAPKLQNGQWMQGDPVKEFQPGKAYIVEFWATWCGPCRVSIPHLNGVYTKFKDKGLVVIGQDCWEDDDKLVAPFVKKMGGDMTYRVALDDKTGDKTGKMAETWMKAAGRNGIPCAFLIDTKGVIAWIGHPMELDEKQDVIEQVLAGKYDLQKAAADYDKQLQEQAAREKEMAPLQEKMTAMAAAIKDKKWDEALADLAAAEKLVPESRREGMALNIDVNRFKILLGKKDYPAAYKLAATISDAHKSNSGLQNFLAWQIVGDKTIEKPDLELAELFVNRANEVAKGKDSGILDTQARVLFLKGKKDEAVKAQAMAVALCDPERKPALQAKLDSYKKGELPAAD